MLLLTDTQSSPLPLFYRSIICWLACIFIVFAGYAQSRETVLAPYQGAEPSRWSFETVFSKKNTKPWHHFYGVWSDFFSGHLQLNADSSFVFFHQYPTEETRIAGRWTRTADTFYFTPATHAALSAGAVFAPAKLCYFQNKLLRIDSTGLVIMLKGPATGAYTRRTQDRYWYFRDKRFDRGYRYDTGFVTRSNLQHMKFGFGVQIGLQPISGYTGAGWGGMVLSSRYVFQSKARSYLSVGTPVMLGFTVLNLPYDMDLRLGLGIELPVIFNYNRKFSWINPKLTGEYFFGGGFAYRFSQFTVSNHETTIERTDNGFGPMINAGFRWATGKYKIRNVELRLSYMKMMNANHSNVFGIGVIRNF